MPPAAAPRHFTPGAGLGSAGLAEDRHARIAARRAFVALKASFLHALRDSPAADWLHHQVRNAEEPVDLWLLRAPVFAALAGADADYRARRQLLRRGLDTIFPELDGASEFGTL